MEFKLAIKLDNDAMTTGWDLSEALSKLSTRLADSVGLPLVEDAGNIIDLNGNLVGSWAITR